MDTRLQGSILEEELLQDLVKVDPTSRLTVNSGALRGDGDIHTKHLVIDAKDKPSSKSFIFTRDEIKKSTKQGRKTRKTPVVVVRNTDGDLMACMPFTELLGLLYLLELVDDHQKVSDD